MYFVKRDVILLAGVILFTFGLIPFMATIYATTIGVGIFFGIKLFVRNRQRFLSKQVREGFCAKCGNQIIDKKCPVCDKSDKSV